MSSAKAVSFLAKKSWHTATMRHMEKVWKAEERSKAENKKLDELKQELAEEREMEELRRAHEALTGIKKKARVDFLYSEPLLNEPSSDDYLLGAKYNSKGDDNDVKNVRDKPGALWLDQPALNSDSIQDKRTKIREDPLFAIRKEEQSQKTALKNNPIKMQRLREQILKEKLREELKKEKKRKHKFDEKPDKKKGKNEKLKTEKHWFPKTEHLPIMDLVPTIMSLPTTDPVMTVTTVLILTITPVPVPTITTVPIQTIMYVPVPTITTALILTITIGTVFVITTVSVPTITIAPILTISPVPVHVPTIMTAPILTITPVLVPTITHAPVLFPMITAGIRRKD